MDAKIISLAAWKAAHKPAINIIEAHNRAVIEWWLVWFRMWLR